MKTSMNSVQQIETYLNGTMDTQERLVFEAHLITDRSLRFHVYLQRGVYSIVKHYHRKKLKEEAERIHQRIFRDPQKRAYQRSIIQLFKH